MWTKICGTTTLEDAQLAAELGADAVGFVFAESRRRVTGEQVAAITPRLPSTVEKVGVFDRPDLRWIVDSANEAGLTAVQLHCAFDEALLDSLQAEFEGRVRLIGVVGAQVQSGDEELACLGQRLRLAFSRPELYAVLLDAARGTQSGGMGEPFHWETVPAIVEGARQNADAQAGDDAPRLLLAGGLTAENVALAVRTLKPWGVDVASGVEAAPGVKSPERLTRFLQITRVL